MKMAVKLPAADHFDLHSKSGEGEEDWIQELKRIMTVTGTESKQRACLHIQEQDLTHPQILKCLNAFAAHGELFSFFTGEELDQLIHQHKFNFASAKSLAIQQTRSQLLEDVRCKLAEDLHILVQLNPRSDILLNEMKETHHLINTSTIIWFGEWSDSGYEHVAQRHLADADAKTELEADEDDLLNRPVPLTAKNAVIQIIIRMHHDVQKVAMDYYQESNHYVHVSPQHFDNFCVTYKQFLRLRHRELEAHRDRFTLGLKGIVAVQKFTENKQDQLSDKSPELVEKQNVLDQLKDKLSKLKYEI